MPYLFFASLQQPFVIFTFLMFQTFPLFIPLLIIIYYYLFSPCTRSNSAA